MAEVRGDGDTSRGSMNKAEKESRGEFKKDCLPHISNSKQSSKKRSTLLSSVSVLVSDHDNDM